MDADLTPMYLPAELTRANMKGPRLLLGADFLGFHVQGSVVGQGQFLLLKRTSFLVTLGCNLEKAKGFDFLQGNGGDQQNQSV